MKKHIFLSFLFFTAITAHSQPGKALNLPAVKIPAFKKDTFNIISFGATGDGSTMNTAAINNAINTCSSQGGGIVLIPAGLWLTGPVVLKSNVNLYLKSQSTLLFTKDHRQYPLVRGNWEGLPQMRMQSPISATGQNNIAITGNGVIDGDGDGWRSVKRYQLPGNEWNKLVESGGTLSGDKETWYPSEQFKKAAAMKNPGLISNEKDSAFYESVHDFLRPNLVVLTGCKKILIDGVTFQNSAAWCLHPLMCEDISIKNIVIKNPSYAHNGDAIDVESCKNVTIENGVFDVGDDALCMKSGRDEEGRKRGIATENITIKNCRVYAAHGGFVIGSEMSGGVKNINVTNCTFIGTDIGLRFKSTRGRGGVVENIFIDSIFMKNIKSEAVLLDLFYTATDQVAQTGDKLISQEKEMKTVDETTPVFKDIHISNVFCFGAEKALFIRGLPEMHASHISINNFVIQSNKGIQIQDASSVKLNSMKLRVKECNPLVGVINSDDVSFNKIEVTGTPELMFRVSGEKCRKIKITNTNSENAEQKIVFDSGVSPTEVTW